MPQIKFEYTKNVDASGDFDSLVFTIHRTISNICSLDIENCKTRTIIHERYNVGSGIQNKGFIHLEIQLFEGRSPEVKKELGETILNLLKEFFFPKSSILNVDITVHLIDIIKVDYFKISN